MLINLDHLGAGVYADPIKALVDAGSGRDVDTVIVDGKTLVEGGRAARVDESAIDEQARQATQRYWQHVPGWHWAGCGVDQIVPPAFPIHRAGQSPRSDPPPRGRARWAGGRTRSAGRRSSP